MIKDCGVDSAIHTNVEAVTTGSNDKYLASGLNVTNPTKGAEHELGLELKQPCQAGSNNLQHTANQVDDNENGGEGDETSSKLPPEGSGWTWPRSGGFVLEHVKTHWDWNDFFYNLTLDLAPAAWNIITDFVFAKALETKDIYLAGLSYMFICLPIIWLVCEKVAEIKISKIKIICYIIGLPAIGTLMMWGLWEDPLLFRPLAILSSILFLGLKSVAVFVHSPAMAQFSLYVSQMGSATEGPMQLLLILHTWLSGGPLHWETLLSSLLDMAKVGAESFLTAAPKDLLRGKPFEEKLILVVKYLPVFLLTALFRNSALAINMINYSQGGLHFPFSTAFTMFLTWVYICIQQSIYQVWFSLLRLHVLPVLQQLDYKELSHALGSEFTVISIWGRLGRRGSRPPQMVMATWFLLHNLVYISLVLESTFTQVGLGGRLVVEVELV